MAKQNLSRANISSKNVSQNDVKTSSVSKTFVIIAVSIAAVLVLSVFLLVNSQVVGKAITYQRSTATPVIQESTVRTSIATEEAPSIIPETTEIDELAPLPPPPSLCVPNTCASAVAECGAVADGCGNYLDCGFCSSGDVCIAPNKCVKAVDQVLPTSAPSHDKVALKEISDVFSAGGNKISKLSAIINAIVVWWNDPLNQ